MMDKNTELNFNQLIFKEDQPIRLDLFLYKLLNKYSRAKIQRFIISGQVMVNNSPVKPSYKIKKGDLILSQINSSDLSAKNSLVPYNFPLDIIFEDNNVIVINKPSGISVHPSSTQNDTIANALVYYDSSIVNAVLDKSNSLSISRPGIVHRLDKETSGVMIVAKNSASLRYLSDQFKNHSVIKTYYAIVFGWPKDEEGTLINYLGRNSKYRMMRDEVGDTIGKKAISHYKVLKLLKDSRNNHLSLLKFKIKTGRTHQIRTQCKLMGHPLVGDRYYSTKESADLSKLLGIKRQMLHSYKLIISINSKTSDQVFIASLPIDFSNLLKDLECNKT